MYSYSIRPIIGATGVRWIVWHPDEVRPIGKGVAATEGAAMRAIEAVAEAFARTASGKMSRDPRFTPGAD